MKPGPDARSDERRVPGQDVFDGKVASVDSRVDPNTRSVDRARAGAERRRPAEARHVPQRAARRAARPTCWWCRKNRWCRSRATCSSTSCRTARRRSARSRRASAASARVQVTDGPAGRRDGGDRRHAEAARRRERQRAAKRRRRRQRAAAADAGRHRAMKISEVSVKRPVFAAVISLMLVILGLLSASRLPVRELPDVEAPIVSIDTNYLGASADVVETKITQVIEERVAGLEGITKITSQSTDGRSSINIEFDPGRVVDEAANDVRDRVARVVGNLPPEADPPEVGKVDFGADPIIWLTLSSDTHERARAHRLRRARAGRPLQRAARRRARAHERRAALRDARLDRSRGAGGAPAHRGRRRGLAAPRERAAARRPPRVLAARAHAAHRDRPQHRAGVPRARRSVAAPTATWCASARWPTCASPPRTSARSRAPTACRASASASSRSRRPTRSRSPRPCAPSSSGSCPTCRRARGSRSTSTAPSTSKRRCTEVVEALLIAMALVHRGHLPVPRQPARHAGAGGDDPGVDHRGVHRHGGARLLDQHADAARAGARHRPGRRRRDRRAREHLPAHGERRAGADRVGRRRARDRLRGRRDDDGARRRVPADVVPAGQRRQAVPRVRLHDRGGGRVLVARRADADADDDVEAVRRRRASLAHGRGRR